MATVTDQKLCLRTQATLDQITNGIYGDVEDGRNTYDLTRAIKAGSTETLTEISNLHKVKPNDLSCPDVKATIKMRLPDCSDAPDVCPDFNCDPVAASKTEYAHCDFQVEDCVYAEFAVSADQFDCSCDDPFATLADHFKRTYRKMKDAKNKKLATKLLASVGNAYDGTNTALTPIPLKIFRETADGSIVPQPQGYHAIGKEYDRQSVRRSSNPIVVTSSEAFNMSRITDPLFAGNVDGFDRNRIGIPSIIYDPALADVVTAAGGTATNPAISFLPNSLALIEYLDFGNPEHQIQGAAFFEGMVRQDHIVRTIMDIGTPIDGVPFLVDAQIAYTVCDTSKHGTVSYKFKQTFDLWCPDQAVMCPDAEFNFKLLWDIQCGAYGCAELFS